MIYHIELINVKILKSGAAFKTMSRVLNQYAISLKTKIKLYDSIGTSMLLYDGESWKGHKEMDRRVRRFESGCLRNITKVK